MAMDSLLYSIELQRPAKKKFGFQRSGCKLHSKNLKSFTYSKLVQHHQKQLKN